MKKFSRAFSLVELVAAIAILLILGVLLMQVSSAIQSTTMLSNRIVDAAAQARLAFDRLALDVGGLMKRDDTDFFAQNKTASAQTGDILKLLSEVRAQDPSNAPADFVNRETSLISYRVEASAANGGKRCLVRAAKAIGWKDTGYMGLNSNGYPPLLSALTTVPSHLVVQDSDFDILAPGAIRMVVGFQLYPSNQTSHLKDGSTVANAVGQIRYSPPVWGTGSPDNQYTDMSQVSCVIVGLAVLDLSSMKKLDAAGVDTLADAFAVPVNGLPLATWTKDTSNLSVLPTSLPLPVRQAVRLYQRGFPITPYGPSDS